MSRQDTLDVIERIVQLMRRINAFHLTVFMQAYRGIDKYSDRKNDLLISQPELAGLNDDLIHALVALQMLSEEAHYILLERSAMLVEWNNSDITGFEPYNDIMWARHNENIDVLSDVMPDLIQ